MSVLSIKQQNCKHTFIVKGGIAAYVRECTKCGYFEVSAL